MVRNVSVTTANIAPACNCIVMHETKSTLSVENEHTDRGVAEVLRRGQGLRQR